MKAARYSCIIFIITCAPPNIRHNIVNIQMNTLSLAVITYGRAQHVVPSDPLSPTERSILSYIGDSSDSSSYCLSKCNTCAITDQCCLRCFACIAYMGWVRRWLCGSPSGATTVSESCSLLARILLYIKILYLLQTFFFFPLKSLIRMSII